MERQRENAAPEDPLGAFRMSTTIPADLNIAGPFKKPQKSQKNNNNNNNNIASHVDDDVDDNNLIRPTFKRYFILVMYSICSMEKSFQWINLSTITNKVSLYYGVDNIAVNWTSVLFMITFIPLVLPTGWLIERIGLRKAILIGSIGIALGAIIKCFSCAQDRFYVIILGQIVVSLSEQFIFCVPAKIASVWFPDHQVSLATGVGIFGNQCGIALGFLIPQAMLAGLETRDDIGIGLYRLFWWTAVVATATLVVLLFLFDDAPRFAPGAARLKKLQDEANSSSSPLSYRADAKLFIVQLKQLITDKNCNFQIVAYGLNVGTGYAVQTLLNQMIAGSHWTDANQVVGRTGLVVIFFGMLGALFWGHLCDLTHRYVFINRVLYVSAIISIGAFGLTLRLYKPFLLYAACAWLGFNLIGYTVVGLDTMVELTYPAPELVSTSVANLSPQIFGTAITFACSAITDAYQSNAATAFLIANLFVGLLVTFMVKERLNRQAAVNNTRPGLDSVATIALGT